MATGNHIKMGITKITNVFFAAISDLAKNNLLKGVLLFAFFFVIQAASAQISHVNSQTSGTGTTSITINKPEGLQVGDLMIANITQRKTQTDATLIGWTKVTAYLVGSADRWATILYRVATSSDVTANNFTFSLPAGTESVAGGISAFRGVNTTTTGGIEVTGTQVSGDNVGPINPPSINTLSNNSMVLFLAQISGTGVHFLSGSWTLGSNTMTQAYTVEHSAEPAAGLAYFTHATAGATGAGSKAISAKARWGGILLALKPLENLSVTGNTDHGSSCPNIATSPVTYTITNNTTSTLTGITVNSDNLEFVVSNAPTSIPASGTATYTLTFTPSSSGARSATITISSTSPVNSITSSVSGTGNALPAISFLTQPGASASVNTDVTYSTQASQANYSWTISGTPNTDYSITSGGVSTSSSLILKWLTPGVKTVSVNYANSSGCRAVNAVSATNTTVRVGANRYAVANGNWNAITTWSATSGGGAGASVPTKDDIVFIGELVDSRVVSIPAGINAICAELNLGASTTKHSYLSILSTATLTVDGDVKHHRPDGSGFSTLDIGTATLTVNGNYDFLGSATNTNRKALLKLSTGTINMNGDLNFTAPDLPLEASYHANTIEFTGSGVMNLKGQFSIASSGYIIPSTGTFNFNGTSVTQSIPIGTSLIVFNDITTNNTSSSGAILGGNISSNLVKGDVSVQSGILSNGGYSMTLASAKNFSVSNGAVFQLTGTSGMAAVSGGGTKTFGITSTVDYAGANQTVSADTYGNLILSGSGTKVMTGVSTVTGDFTMSGNNTTNAATTVTLSVGGNMTVGSGNTLTLTNGNPSLNVTGNTVVSGAVTSPGAGKTFGGSFTINSGGSWTEQAGPIYNFAGNFTNNGTFSAGTSTANFNGTTVIGGSSTTSLHNITVASGSTLTTPSASSLTATGSVANSGSITQAAGAVEITGALTINNSATYSVSGTSTLTLQGDFIINGTGVFNSGTGTINFTGGTAHAKFQKDNGVTQILHNVTVAKGSSDGSSYYNLNVNSDLSVSGFMVLNSGDVIVKKGNNSENSIGNKILEIKSGGYIKREPLPASANPKVYGSLKIIGSNNGSRGDGSCQVVYPMGGQTNAYQPVFVEYPSCNESQTITITHFKSSNNGHTKRAKNTEKVLGVADHEYWEVTPDDATKSAIASSADGISLALTYRTSNQSQKYFPTVDHTGPSNSIGHVSTTDMNDVWNPISTVVAFISQDNDSDKDYNGIIKISGVKSFSYVAPIVIPNSANPVQLINFTAKKTTENKVALSWVTATESVNKGFHVERQSSALSGKFEPIGFVNTKAQNGNSQSNLYYNFLDPLPKPGATSFYRLVQEDLDGTRTNSEVRLVRLDGHSVVLVFPNPSNGNVVINRTDEGKKMNIQVYDQSGRLVKQVENIVESTYRLSLSQPGMYNIKLSHPETGEHSIQRIVIHK